MLCCLPTYLPRLALLAPMCVHVVPFECECGLEYLSTVPVDTSYLTLPVLGYIPVPTELEELSFTYRDESATQKERERAEQSR